ncbi:hypothetical protein [Streptomyces sp. NPDC126499]|uniref:hypothetical protein n=1 Tax=Streptomyces sp. NPDC126499 TaxID=3155314 RepID=UPI0033254AF8
MTHSKVRTAEAGLARARLPGLGLSAVVAEQPDPLLFATVSGAHLYCSTPTGRC